MTIIVNKGIMVLGPFNKLGPKKYLKSALKYLKKKLFRLFGTWSPLFSLKREKEYYTVNNMNKGVTGIVVLWRVCKNSVTWATIG